MIYKVSLDLSNTAKRIFDGLEVSSSSTVTSLSAFRKIAQAMNKACVASRQRMEDERKELLKTYSNTIVMEKMQELTNSYNAKIKDVQNRLTEKLSAILTAKEEAVSRYVTLPPSDEQMKLLNVLQMRGNHISDTEWNMIVKQCADNYQALCVVRDIADRMEKPFAMPFTPDDDLQLIKAIKGICEEVISRIDKEPDTGNTVEFLKFGEENNGRVTQIIKMLDKSVSSATPLSLADELRDARDHALHVGAYELSNYINHFLYENIISLEGKAPPAHIIQDARELINLGMKAVETTRTPYEKHRDEMIDKLVEHAAQNESN